MGTWTIASTFEISVGTVTGVDITVDYLAGRDAEAGGGDVTGPASAVDENIAVFNSTTGKLIKDGLINKSAITANTAKISFDSTSSTRLANTSGTNTGDQVGDGVTITGAGTVGSPFVSAGGTQYQNYDINFWTDLADATNWQGIYGLSLSTNLPDEYSVGYIVTKANPAIGVAASKLRDIRILGMARANQTVIKLRMFTPSTVTGNHIDRISIFKVKWLNASNFTYITNLYEGNVTWSSDGHYEVLAAAFAVTTISEKDSIYVALGGTATTDIGTYIMQLTCSI